MHGAGLQGASDYVDDGSKDYRVRRSPVSKISYPIDLLDQTLQCVVYDLLRSFFRPYASQYHPAKMAPKKAPAAKSPRIVPMMPFEYS